MSTLSFGGYRLDTLKARLYHLDQPLELEPQIYGILALLITRHGELVSRDDIIDSVWDGRTVSNNLIDNRIKSARAAIGDDGKTQRYIKTYPNLGYKFIGEIKAVEAISLAQPTKYPDEPKPSAQEISIQVQPSHKSPSFLQKSTAWKIAAMAVVGVFGFFILSESTRSGITQVPPLSEVTDEEAIYRLAFADDPDAPPRVAVLPVEAVGKKSDYGFLPEVIRGEINHHITGIDGITVVALSSGVGVKDDVKKYNTLRKDFGLDYAIASRVTPHGKDYKLNVSLLDVGDGAVLYNEAYDLNLSSENDLNKSPAIIASKVTLITANALNLSVDRLPKSWENYEFYKKYEEANLIGESHDYEDLKISLELLREVMAEEPNFIPAYAAFLKYLSHQIFFYGEEQKILFKEQATVGKVMDEIAPEAPETLIKNAFMRDYDVLHSPPSIRPYDPRNKVSVAEYILKSDPDNLEAHLILSRFSGKYRSRAKTVETNENALRLMPTNASVLSQYSDALFCNQQIDKARSVLDRASQWHPDHRDILYSEIKYNRRIGNYSLALMKIKQLLNRGYVDRNEANAFSLLFFDLGHPELFLPHVRYSPDRAKVYARMGDKEATIREGNGLEHKPQSYNARMMVDDDYVPDYYLKKHEFKRLDPTGEPVALVCSLRRYIRRLHNFKYLDPANYEKIGSYNYETNLPVLTEYYKDKDIKDLRVQEEFTSLMGLHLLQGRPDEAMEVMDAAIERGFLFIGTLKEPYLRELQSHPGFAERLERMQKSADLLIETYYHDGAKSSSVASRE